MAKLGLAVVLVALALATGALLVIGDPPGLRVDALWVKSHLDEVQILFGAIGLAFLATVPAATRRDSRMVVGAIWIVAGSCALTVFRPRIVVICTVAAERMF